MQIFKYLLIIGLLFIITGCTNKCTPPPPEIKVVYKTKIVKVEVPPKPIEVSCEFSGEGFEPTIKLLKCVELQKRAIEAYNGTLKKKEK